MAFRARVPPVRWPNAAIRDGFCARTRDEQIFTQRHYCSGRLRIGASCATGIRGNLRVGQSFTGLRAGALGLASRPGGARNCSGAPGDVAAAAAAAAALEPGAAAGPVSELGWLPPDIMLRLVDALHAATGLEWWASIVLGTVALRLVMLPVIVHAVRNKCKMTLMQPEMLEVQVRYKRLGLHERTQEASAAFAREMQAVSQRNGFHPLYSLAPLFLQGPVFMSMFLGLRRFGDAFPDAVSGGTLWFVNLAVTDATFALPILTGTTMFAAMEFGIRTQTADTSPEGELMQNVVRGFCLTMPLIASYMPCSVLVYWVSANSFTLLQSAVLAVPAVRQALAIPKVPKHVTEEAARLRAELRQGPPA